jgi:Phage tail repeat like
MATNFPNALDALPKPNPTDLLTSPAHAQLHRDTADAIGAIQAKIGVNGSTDVNSLDFQVKQKAAASHTHPYAPVTHSHAIGDIGGLQTALDAKAAKSVTDAHGIQLGGFTLAKVSVMPASPDANTIYFVV